MRDESSSIYLVGPSDAAIELKASMYEKEEHFQSLLAKYPALMDGEQFDPEKPRRWLLVGREVGISDDEGSRWSLDHLFVDQDAIPTLVEVKRKSDSRLRREVVGQMLDYAANSSAHWTEEWFSNQFSKRCTLEGIFADEELSKFLAGEQIAVEGFWSEVYKNLKSGRMRLVFVADRIPPELTRIVEYLNASMTHTEVLALELRYFTGGGYSTHIPRVLGHIARVAVERKAASQQRRVWSREDFLEDLGRRLADNKEAEIAIRSLLDSFADEFDIKWGTGKERGSFTPLDPEISSRGPVTVYSDGELQIKTGWLQGTERGERWKLLLREKLKQASLRFDEGSDTSVALSVGDWYRDADKYREAIVGSRPTTSL